MPMHYDDLLPGDIIFTLSKSFQPLLGHVAVCSYVEKNPQDIRIIHATNNPKYFGVAQTHLNSSSSLPEGMQYTVIRCLEYDVLEKFLELLFEFATYRIAFSSEKNLNLKQMNTANLSLANQCTIANKQFSEASNIAQLKQYLINWPAKLLDTILDSNENGFTCSSVIMFCLQIAFLKTKKKIPASLHIFFHSTTPRMLHHVLPFEPCFKSLEVLTVEYQSTEEEKKTREAENILFSRQARGKRYALHWYYQNMRLNWHQSKIQYSMDKTFALQNILEHSSYPHYLERMDYAHLKGKTIGFFVGSFDPVHRGHQELVETILQKNLCDYVCIYPVPGGDEYKNRISFEKRLKMLALAFKHNSKIIISNMSPLVIQAFFNRYLKDINTLGIMGVDVADSLCRDTKKNGIFMRGIPVPEKHRDTTIGAIMAIRADRFIVSTREKENLNHLDGAVVDRKIVAEIKLTQYSNLSSTQVKKRITEQSLHPDMLNPLVYAFITQEKLYVELDQKQQSTIVIR